jgi:vitamin B12 transporter
MKSPRTAAGARRIALTAAFAAFTPAALAAQARDTMPADSARHYRLDEMTVTARRAPAPAAAIPQRVDVVTARDVERTGARDLAELLKRTAAVDVVQYPGLLSGVGLRGFRPETGGINKHVLFLVDGRPVASDNLASFDLASIERVEVVRGPASALYGSNAMGGVVNLVTRRSTGAPGGQASLRYGSFETLDFTGRAGGRIGARLDADVGLSLFRQGADYRIGEGNALRGWVGADSAVKLLPSGEARVAELGDGARMPYSRHDYGSGRARLGYDVGGGWRANAAGEWFRADRVRTPGDINFGTAFALIKDVDRRDAELGVTGPERLFSPSLRVFTSSSSNDFYSSADETRFKSFAGEVRTWGGQLQGTTARGPVSIVAGLDYTASADESRVFSAADVRSAPYSPNAAVRSGAAFAEARVGLLGDRLTGNVGGRIDRVTLELRDTPFRDDVVAGDESFTVFNPSAGVQYAFGGGFRAHATAGRAFVAPSPFTKAGLVASTFNNRVGYTIGNPDLEAEHSFTIDAGLGYSSARTGLEADATWFRTRVDDRITSASAFFPIGGGAPTNAAGVEVGSVTTYVNADEARMEGIEWRLSYDFGALMGGRWSLRAFGGGTHLYERDEVLRGATIDADRFAGRTSFSPEEVFGAFVLGSGTTERQIYNVADVTLNYGLEWDDLRRFSARLSGRYVGERLDLDFTDFSNISDIRYPAFMVLDAFAETRFAERYRLGVLVNNLTDENYYEKRGYNLPGRSVSLKLTVGF